MNIENNIFKYAILFSIMIKCVSYIPLILQLNDTQYTQNIPYITLFLELGAYIILVIIACMKQYLIHLMFFLCFIICVIYIIFQKIKLHALNLYSNFLFLKIC